MLVAWLRRILARTLADAVKHYERDKRDVALERSLEADLDRSASGFAAWLAADQTSPSGCAERNEELLRMVEALAELPEPMRRSLCSSTVRAGRSPKSPSGSAEASPLSPRSCVGAWKS